MPRERPEQGIDGYVVRRVTPAEQRASAIAALRARRYDIAAQRGWDLAIDELLGDAVTVAVVRHLCGVPSDFPPELMAPEQWERARAILEVARDALSEGDR